MHFRNPRPGLVTASLVAIVAVAGIAGVARAGSVPLREAIASMAPAGAHVQFAPGINPEMEVEAGVANHSPRSLRAFLRLHHLKSIVAGNEVLIVSTKHGNGGHVLAETATEPYSAEQGGANPAVTSTPGFVLEGGAFSGDEHSYTHVDKPADIAQAPVKSTSLRPLSPSAQHPSVPQPLIHIAAKHTSAPAARKAPLAHEPSPSVGTKAHMRVLSKQASAGSKTHTATKASSTSKPQPLLAAVGPVGQKTRMASSPRPSNSSGGWPASQHYTTAELNAMSLRHVSGSVEADNKTPSLHTASVRPGSAVPPKAAPAGTHAVVSGKAAHPSPARQPVHVVAKSHPVRSVPQPLRVSTPGVPVKPPMKPTPLVGHVEHHPGVRPGGYVPTLPVAALPPPVVETWVVEPGMTLESVLQGWADRAGWKVVYHTDVTYPMAASADFSGSFLKAVHALLYSIHASPTPIVHVYEGNHVILVTTVRKD